MPVIKAMKEIRSKRFYIPELELLMVDQQDEPIGYCMFSRFHLENARLKFHQFRKGGNVF